MSFCKIVQNLGFMTEFCLQILNFNGFFVLRWVRLIIFVLIFNILIHFTKEQEEALYQTLLFAQETGEWGPYNQLSPTEKYVVWVQTCRGGRVCG